MTDSIFFGLALVVVACPAALVAILGVWSLMGRSLDEQKVNALTFATTAAGLLAAIAVLVLMLAAGTRHVAIELGDWVVIPQQHFHFHLKFLFDRLSVPFVILSFLLCGVVSAFTSRYLHREAGFGRFYLCYAIFLLGMVVSSVAGTIEVLFFGWELVGLSSALLVAFFHERRAPVQNGLRVWTIYRLADAAFLIAAVALHHTSGGGDFDKLIGTGSWPYGEATLSSAQALPVGLLLLIAAAGKSALVPFSGWLPRAMEGPTPSSAIFYGALSVHLGAFLLLRVSPILEASTALSVAVVVVGLLTALYAAITAGVQSDIKSALAFASLTQVGIIVAEIGLGFRYIALIHIIGHACLRTLQLLRAPTLLHDYHALENAIGERSVRRPAIWGRWLPAPVKLWWYRWALHRGYLDSFLAEYIARPFAALFVWCDKVEHWWTDTLSGRRSGVSNRIDVYDRLTEESRP